MGAFFQIQRAHDVKGKVNAHGEHHEQGRGDKTAVEQHPTKRDEVPLDVAAPRGPDGDKAPQTYKRRSHQGNHEHAMPAKGADEGTGGHRRHGGAQGDHAVAHGEIGAQFLRCHRFQYGVHHKGDENARAHSLHEPRSKQHRKGRGHQTAHRSERVARQSDEQ